MNISHWLPLKQSWTIHCLILQSTRTNQITSTLDQQSKDDVKTKNSSKEELLAAEREERFRKLKEWKVGSSSSYWFPRVSHKGRRIVLPTFYSLNFVDVVNEMLHNYPHTHIHHSRSFLPFPLMFNFYLIQEPLCIIANSCHK